MSEFAEYTLWTFTLVVAMSILALCLPVPGPQNFLAGERWLGRILFVGTQCFALVAVWVFFVVLLEVIAR